MVDSLGRKMVRDRRHWSLLEKQAIVAECILDGASVSGVARRHGVATSQLFAWRRQYGDASAVKKPSNRAARQDFAAVMVVPDMLPDDMATQTAVVPEPRLEIVLCNGAQLIASGGVPLAILVEAIKAMASV